VALIVVTTALIVAPLTAIASHSFTDVPDTNTFHADIAWLADAGVTKGCNPPANTEFCPNDNVSRGQMSAFLKRLSEGKIVDAATAVNADNADTLDGLDSTEITSLVWASTDNELEGTSVVSDVAAETNSVAINVPVDGVLVISGMSYLNNDGSSAFFAVRPLVDGSNVPSHQAAMQLAATGTGVGETANLSYTITVAITAGAHTVSQTAGPQTGTTSYFYNRNHLTVTFVPNGSVALAATTSATGGDANGS
jgi:hypothetical protein